MKPATSMVTIADYATFSPVKLMEQPGRRAIPPSASRFDWSRLPPLPPARGHSRQPGLAGAFTGIHEGALIVAGGANFHDLMPWQGGQKSWENEIFILEYGKEHPEWMLLDSCHLSGARAYGFSASTSHGVLCVGGADACRHYADVFLLRWNAEDRRVEQTELPPLPQPLANMGGGMAEGKIYVLGGQAEAADSGLSVGYTLDFTGESLRTSEWRTLPVFPGKGRMFPLTFALGGGCHAGFYVFGGRSQAPGALPEFHRDGYRYDSRSRQWMRLRNLSDSPDFPFMAGAMVPLSAKSGLLIGGDNGHLFLAKEKLAMKIREERVRQVGNGGKKLRLLLEEETRLLESHPGFCRSLYRYSAESDEWAEAGSFPGNAPAVTTAILRDNVLLLPSGEIRPGIRSPEVWLCRIRIEDNF